jgi:putative membrane protein
MNKLAISAAVATLLAAAAASVQSIGEKTGVNSALGISPPRRRISSKRPRPATCSKSMPPRSHKIAQDKGNPDEKKFAEQMITDRTKTSTDLEYDGQRRCEGGYSNKPRQVVTGQASRRQGFGFRRRLRSDASAHKDAASLFEHCADPATTPSSRIAQARCLRSSIIWR